VLGLALRLVRCCFWWGTPSKDWSTNAQLGEVKVCSACVRWRAIAQSNLIAVKTKQAEILFNGNPKNFKFA